MDPSTGSSPTHTSRLDALSRLPETYRRLFELLDAGAGPDDIGATLGIDEAALPALIQVGTTKLAALLAEDTSRPGDPDE